LRRASSPRCAILSIAATSWSGVARVVRAAVTALEVAAGSGLGGEHLRPLRVEPPEAREFERPAVPREEGQVRDRQVVGHPEHERAGVAAEQHRRDVVEFDRGGGVEPRQAVERQLAPVPAEGPSGRGREPPQAVERQPARRVRRQRGGGRVGDRPQGIEVQVALMAGEFPGHRRRQPQQPVQVEVRLVVADDRGRVDGGRGVVEREVAVRRRGDRVGGVVAEVRLGGRDGPREEGDEFPRPCRVEMADGGRVLAQREAVGSFAHAPAPGGRGDAPRPPHYRRARRGGAAL
jgi:hypothetical protein